MIIDTDRYTKLSKSLLVDLFEHQAFPLYMAPVKHSDREAYGVQVLRYNSADDDRLIDTHVLNIARSEYYRSNGSKMPYFMPTSIFESFIKKFNNW
jgi:hypothetical protein